MPDSIEAAGEILDRDGDGLRHISALLDLVEGFETPYSLELLATVHFASIQTPATSEPVELARRVVSWSHRKARMFTDRHVSIAAERLAGHHLLPG